MTSNAKPVLAVGDSVWVSGVKASDAAIGDRWTVHEVWHEESVYMVGPPGSARGEISCWYISMTTLSSSRDFVLRFTRDRPAGKEAAGPALTDEQIIERFSVVLTERLSADRLPLNEEIDLSKRSRSLLDNPR